MPRHKAPSNPLSNPPRGDQSPIAPDDAAGLADLEASTAEVGAHYLRDWLDHLTDAERAQYEDILAELEAQASGDAPFGDPAATAVDAATADTSEDDDDGQ